MVIANTIPVFFMSVLLGEEIEPAEPCRECGQEWVAEAQQCARCGHLRPTAVAQTALGSWTGTRTGVFGIAVVAAMLMGSSAAVIMHLDSAVVPAAAAGCLALISMGFYRYRA